MRLKYCALLMCALGTPVSAAEFEARGSVSWVGSLGTVEGALAAHVRDGESNLLADCRDDLAFLGEKDAQFEQKRKAVMASYFGDTKVRLTIDRDAGGRCHITGVAPTA